MIRVKVQGNYANAKFPSPRELNRILARRTRPRIAARLVEVARAKIGSRQRRERTRLFPSAYSGGQSSTPGWAPTKFGNNLLDTGKIIRNRIKSSVSGKDILFGVSGNSRYAKIQRAHEFGARINVTEEMERNRFKIDNAWKRLKGSTSIITIPERSYIRSTVFQLENWMKSEVMSAMRDSMVNLRNRR